MVHCFRQAVQRHPVPGLLSFGRFMKTEGPIVAAVDFSEESTAVVSHAIAVAESAKLPLTLVHVIDSGVLRHRAVTAGRSPEEGVLIAKAHARLAAMVAELRADLGVDIEVTCGRPLDEIHALLEKSAASLLVMGANDLTKKRLGSVASGCLRTVRCDVLVLRDWQGGTFSRILVCIDLSPASGRALGRAVSWAARHGAKLDIAYVMYPPSRDIWGHLLEQDLEGDESYAHHCRRVVREQVNAFISPHAERLASIEHTISVLESVSPGLALQYHAADTGADLAVLGSRPHSRLAALFSASIAEHLLHATTVSVLAVRGHS